jgi:hypothetical protein
MAAHHGTTVPNTGARGAGFLDRAGNEIHTSMLAWVPSPAARRPARLALWPRHGIRTRDQVGPHRPTWPECRRDPLTVLPEHATFPTLPTLVVST